MSPPSETIGPSGCEIVLSICIPTRERRRYLEGLLESLTTFDLPFAVEVVVSDNDSTDGTDALCRAFGDRLPLRYLRQSPALSAFGNLYAALCSARGRYAIYLADDDRLFRDPLIDAIAWLQANPGFSALYGPQQETSLVDGTIGPMTGHPSVATDFRAGERLELAAFLLDTGIVPECAIFRTDCFTALLENPAIFFAYHIIERAIGLGAVRFTPTSFYNAIGRHFPDDARPTLGLALIGDVQSWEKHRRGLEVLLYSSLIGAPPVLQRATVARLAPQLDTFVNHKLSESFTLLWNSRRFLETLDLARLMIGRRLQLPCSPDIVNQITLAALFETISQRCRTPGGHNGIVLYGFPGGADIAAVWAVHYPTIPVVEHAPPMPPDERLLVAWDDAAAGRARAEGWPSWRVVSFTTAYKQLDLAPWLAALPPRPPEP